MVTYWAYDKEKNTYSPSTEAPFSAFPTIVDIKNRNVYCRFHHSWEPILAFNSNVLKAGCGMLYQGPFSVEESLFNYGYKIEKKENIYSIKTLTQKVSIKNRRLLEYHFDINFETKRLLKNNTPVFEEQDISGFLCKELTDDILNDMGNKYKEQIGIKPTITSKYSGFSVVLGYLLSPFNVNFYKIASHWGLNPYDKDFTSLSSGDTPNAENEMFSSLGIRPTKSIRKIYQKNPYSVVAYAAVKDLGFTDVNILQKSVTKDFYLFFDYYQISFANGDIFYHIRNPFQRFIADMLAISNEKTVWNSLQRTVRYLFDKNIPNSIITDGINMYYGISEHLSDREKKQIMNEGFNIYTHDFILRRHNELARENRLSSILQQEANVHFVLEKEFLDLEYKCGEDFYLDKKTGERIPISDDQRWCFYVAKDSRTLKIIGSEMSNCVGWGYKEAVLQRRATIVYALYKNQYKICIEVTPDFTIRQAFGPHNSQLQGEAYDMYSEWCHEKKINRRNVFSRQLAPRL